MLFQVRCFLFCAKIINLSIKKITDQKLYFVHLTVSASCIKRTQNIFRCFMRDRMA